MKMRNFLLIVAGLTTLGSNHAAQNYIYPVKWTPTIHLKSLNELPRILASPDYVGSEVQYRKDDQSTMAKTCNDYFKLTKSGYYAANNAEIAAESFFISACDPLMVLKNAKAAHFSAVRNFDLQKDYRNLPAVIISPNLSHSADEQTFSSIGKTYPDVDVEHRHDKPDNLYSITLSSKQASFTSNITILAWGDFDDDGNDDILIFVANYPYKFEGTFHSYKIYALTRKSAKQPLHTIELSDSKIVEQ